MAITELEPTRLHARRWSDRDDPASLPTPVWVEPARRSTQRADSAGLAAVIALPHSPRPARAPTPAPVRLTSRGRLALTLVAVCCVLAITGLARSSADASAAGPAGTSPATVVVQPGDTLWDVALRADPHGDPRATVARISDLNHIAAGRIRPGQRLIVPAG